MKLAALKTLWVYKIEVDNIQYIKKEFSFKHDSEAIRFAINSFAKQIKGEKNG